ncbi:MAG TPA: hypothetical protein EYP85_05715, partial [Armatimonadetes bacterium]|nr:hypothetical protein [Armatimonadota bacterium]
MKSTDPILTSRLKARALELGADLVGIAAVERYEHAPPQMTPTAHLPSAQAVVVIAIHHPDAAIELGGEPTPHDQGPYAIQGTMNDKLEHISFWLARLLEAEGHRVVALPATNVWRFRPYKDNPTPFAPDLSNIHAAAAAGLGEIGWSGLLLTPEFGPRQRFCCLVTDAPLEPSPLYSGPPLCDRCHVCVQVCPTEAFTQEVAGESVVRIGERTFTYANKNKWRCAWAEHFGLHLDLPKPEKIDEQVILATLAKHGRYAGEMGSCLRYCLPPHLRVKDPAYTRVWRRRRPGLEVGEPEARDGEPGLDRRTTEQVKRLAFESGADLVAIARREQFETTDLRDYLPDARSVVVFAAHYPETLAHPDDPAWPSERVGAVLQRKLDFLQLDLCRLLEERGYSALPKSGFPEEVAAEVAGLAEREASGRLRTPEYGLRQQTACVLTSAPLAPGRWAGRPARLPRPTAPQDWAAATEELAGFLRQRGADLVGVAPVERFDSLVEGLRLVIDEEALGLEVRDAGGPHGPVIPQIELGEARVLHPNDHLPGARTVLVLGLHYPAQNLVRATEPPAEAAGPYAYATYQTLRELEMLAHEAMRYLEAWGCRAVPTADLLGTASVVASPRGYLPDATANALAAVAAGLGEL